MNRRSPIVAAGVAITFLLTGCVPEQQVVEREARAAAAAARSEVEFDLSQQHHQELATMRSEMKQQLEAARLTGRLEAEAEVSCEYQSKLDELRDKHAAQLAAKDIC